MTALDWRPIRQIHRADDSWICFCRKGAELPDGTRAWLELGGIRADELETMFPQVVRSLFEDSFFSINGMFKAERQEFETLRDGRRVPYTHPLTDLPRVRRAEDALRYLNAFYVDLDEHAGPRDLPELVEGVIRLQQKKVIPPASMLVRSGRGLWVLWLIRNPKDECGQPQPAFPEKIRKYLRIQRAIVDRLAALGADRSAKDAARCIRLPGSLNTGAQAKDREVKYWPQLDDHGNMATYTLDEIADWLGIASEHQPWREPACNGRGISGWIARWQTVIDEIQTLREVRGGFTRGSRRQALFLLCIAGSKIMSGEQLLEAAIELGANGCVPPLSARVVEAKLRRTVKWMQKHPTGNWITHQRCAQMLNVTDEEKPCLRRWFKVKEQRPSKQTIRRSVILQIVKNLGPTPGHVPSVREMQEHLRKRGLTVDLTTVLRDYVALGLNYTEVLFLDVGGTEAGGLSCYSKAKCNTLDHPSDPKPGFKLSLQRLKVAERISQRRQLIQDFV